MILVACSKETPAPPPAASSATPDRVATAAPGAQTPPYEEAVIWFRSAPAFRFAITENGVRGEGEMRRKTVGAEVVTVNVDGEEWRAEAGPRGVTWSRGGKPADAPVWGPRLYQRVTVAFDPQKVEGAAQLVEPGHYRFTNANTGEVHDVWVAGDRHIEHMTIGGGMDLKIEPIS